MASISLAEARKLERRAMSASASARRARELAGEKMGQVVRSLEVTASAGMLGYMRGRYGKVLWWGAPRELVVGLGLHALALWDIGDGMSPHFAAFGDGALAGFVNIKGISAGVAARRLAGETAQPLHETVSGHHVTDGDVEQFASPV